MNFLTFISVWILVLFSIPQSCTLGTGKVFIGFMPNSSLISSVSNEASIVTGSLNLPVYIRVFGNDYGSELPITDNVSVECKSNKNEPGFSAVSFSSLNLSEAVPEGIIKVSLIKAGRAIKIRCFGNSLEYIDDKQFIMETSLSDSWSLIIFPKLTVSISRSRIVVSEPNGTFRVEFSEPIKNFPVVVSCDTDHSAELIIFDTIVKINSSFTWIKYFLVNGSLTSPVKVSCTGKYMGGNQPDTIQSGSSTLFIPKEVSVDLTSFSLDVKSLTFEAFLTPRGLSEEEIQIQCFSNTVHNQKDAFKTTNSISCLKNNNSVNQTSTPKFSSSQTTPPSSVSSTTLKSTSPILKQLKPWLVNNPNFTLKAKGATLRLRRQLSVEKPTSELVVLTCCAALSTDAQALPKRKLSLLFTVSLQPFQNYKESQLISIDKIHPTRIGNPAKKNFANCPCDMTWDNCDVNCCCDVDCRYTDIKSFNKCIPSHQGGQQPPPPIWMCSNYPSGPFLLLCAVYQDSAYLGRFRYDKPIISNFIELKKRHSDKEYTFGRKSGSSIGLNMEYLLLNYGSPIHIAIPNTLNLPRGMLTLPQRTFSGQCSTTAPVPFLKNINSDCVYQMTPDMCSDKSILSATSFILSTALRTSLSQTPFAIFNDQNQKIVNTDVNYYCSNRPQPYLKSLDTLSDILTSRINSSQNFTIPDTCIIDNGGLYHCPENVEEPLSTKNEDMPPRCSWDNGFTIPPTPILRELPNGPRCDNVVLSVLYHFTWSANTIEFLNASVILGNVSLFNIKEQRFFLSDLRTVINTRVISGNLIMNNILNETTQVNPRYQVKYTHRTNSSENDSIERSGNPGYNIGKPLWSGTMVKNDTNDTFLYVNQHESQQLSFWEPSPSGLCSMVEKRRIQFGEDLSTSCYVPVVENSLKDCQNLRKWLLYQLSILMPSDRIGRYGNNTASRSSDWVHILRENITDRFPEIFNETELDTSNDTNSDSVDNFSKVTCYQVPSGVVLNIMYAITGLVQGSPIKEIIGARINYVYDNWTYTCSDNVIDESCVSTPWNSNDTEPNKMELYKLFSLSAVVHFIKVPVRKPKPIISYYGLPISKECWFQFFDTCIEDFSYFITRQQDEKVETFMKKLVITLVFSILAFIYLIVLGMFL